MNQAELIEAAGGYKVDPEKIISGGPMMGFSMFTVDVPVTKTSSSILCFTKDEVAQYEPTACIKLWKMCGGLSKSSDSIKTCRLCGTP